VFGNFPAVAEASSEFIAELEKLLQLPEAEQLLGSVFMSRSGVFRDVFVSYGTHYHDATEMLTELCKDSNIAQFLARLHIAAETPHRWDLASFLIMPLQRVLKYPLLLRELLDATPSTHPDRPRLLEAANMMADVATVSIGVGFSLAAPY
jgi:hypothetical protein